MEALFTDRYQAGRQLAEAFIGWPHNGDVVVLALPPGGVPVAYELAQVLRTDMDVLLVRELGLPDRPGVSVGSIGEDGTMALNHALIRSAGVSRRQVDTAIRTQVDMLAQQRNAYRGGRPAMAVAAQTTVLVCDGLLDGSAIRAAIRVLRKRNPASIIVAVPVASAAALNDICGEIDEAVCLNVPGGVNDMKQCYLDCREIEGHEVRRLLGSLFYSTPLPVRFRRGPALPSEDASE